MTDKSTCKKLRIYPVKQLLKHIKKEYYSTSRGLSEEYQEHLLFLNNNFQTFNRVISLRQNFLFNTVLSLK